MVKKYTFLLFSFFILQGCFSDKKVTNDLENPICISSQSVCSVKTPTGEFFIKFNQATPKAETPFEIHVNYQGHHKIEKLRGFIEGIDMFMGKIPLFLKAAIKKEIKPSKENNKKLNDTFNEQSFVSMAMFGSCSLDTMRWRVMFEAEFIIDGAKQTQPFFIEFTSQR